MKTLTELGQRYTEQKKRRDDYIADKVKQTVDEWTVELEKKVELAYEGKEPVCTATVYSNQLNSTAPYQEHHGEILCTAAQTVVDLFCERGFRAHTVNCQSCTGVRICWDPDNND